MARRPPIFNIPPVVSFLLFIMTGLHLLRHFASDQTNFAILLNLAFIPARYVLPAGPEGIVIGGDLARLWTPLTYAFLHGDATHLMVNVLWMAVFGSAVAVRFGAGRFLLFCALTAMAAAGAHYVGHTREIVAMVGASGAISGLTAAAALFMFEPGGALSAGRYPGSMAHLVPIAGAYTSLRNPRVLVFIGVWFVLNLLFGIGAFPVANDGAQVAWEAHIGGFVAGLLLFSFFDPVPPAVYDPNNFNDSDQKIGSRQEDESSTP